mmetsp:Transcript_48128/g.148537  ORF Transcript_48128/g.148537 Transcript_48128/m.148537 type:complete len:202 (+) Transcript_48128:1200-1805(+)
MSSTAVNSHQNRDSSSRKKPPLNISFHRRRVRSVGIGSAGMYNAKRIVQICAGDRRLKSKKAMPEKRLHADCVKATTAFMNSFGWSPRTPFAFHCCHVKGRNWNSTMSIHATSRYVVSAPTKSHGWWFTGFLEPRMNVNPLSTSFRARRRLVTSPVTSSSAIMLRFCRPVYSSALSFPGGCAAVAACDGSRWGVLVSLSLP